MKSPKECLARHANAEDSCARKFWAAPCYMQRRHSLHACSSEGPIQSTTLLDEEGLLTVMRMSTSIRFVQACTARRPSTVDA
jgi:hypothetical protein